MDYLITTYYEDKEKNETFVLNETEMHSYVTENHGDTKFTVSEIKCIMDLS